MRNVRFYLHPVPTLLSLKYCRILLSNFAAPYIKLDAEAFLHLPRLTGAGVVPLRAWSVVD
jgi:hypothetical protein